MDDQAMTQTYGTATLPEGTLVTFALFAYNQEQYIREAVEGAFSQIYEPMEIILSDDCSSDRTFEIMQEMAAAYRGPHRVRVRKNIRNLGLIKHVNNTIEGSNSEFIVMAAGDDISRSDRASCIMDAFARSPEIDLVHSSVLVIDQDGNEGGRNRPPFTELNIDPRSLSISSSVYIGATGAIRKRLYEDFGPIREHATYEDLILGFRASLSEGLYYIDKDLVSYRQNIGVSSQFRNNKGSRQGRRISYLNHRLATLRQRNADVQLCKHPYAAEIARNIGVELRRTQAKLSYHNAPVHLLCLLASRDAFSQIKAISSETKFILGIID